MIVTLELPQGAVVSEAYLMERLNCGRTPLREALQRLTREQLIIPAPRRGFSIAGLSVVDLVHLIEALVLVDGLAAPLAAQRITDEQLSKLEAPIVKVETAGSKIELSTVAECDFEFHSAFAQATGNRYLAETIVHLHRLLTRFAYAGWRREGNVETSFAEHRQLLAALKSRDLAEAERQAREHILRARERIMAAL